MRMIFIYIIIASGCFSCKRKSVQSPVWLNPSSEISVPADILFFEAEGKEWNASLLSFTQSVPLSVQHTETGFLITPKSKAGITEGPAKLVVSRKGKKFYYDIALKNKYPGDTVKMDYRSSKTVNPDSSLQQQQITHRVDRWRNIIVTGGTSACFFEKDISLPPVTGVFRAQPEVALSSFYILPGSCTNLPVSARYSKEANAFLVTAGLLKDRYNNIVADGTLVTFKYNDGQYQYRMETALLKGYATAKIPAPRNVCFSLTAIVNETVSKPITLLAK